MNYHFSVNRKGVFILEISNKVCDEAVFAYLVHSLKRLLLRDSKLFNKVRHILIKFENGRETAINPEVVEAIKDYVLKIKQCELYLMGSSNHYLFSLIFCVSPKLGLIYVDPLRAIATLSNCGEEGKRMAKILQGSKLISLLNSFVPATLTDGGTNLRGYQLLDNYAVGPFSISIFKGNDLKHYYYVDLLKEVKALLPVLYDVEDELTKWLRRSFTLENFKFSTLINRLEKRTKEILSEKGISSRSLIKNLSIYISFKVVGLIKFLPFLLDDHIEEFYLDRPSTFIYLDHDIWGRCLSNIQVSESEVTSLLTHVRLEGRKEVNLLNPSLKEDMVTKHFHVRISIDVPPLSAYGICVDVRKLRRKPFTLAELVYRASLSVELAAYLLLAIRHRRNILILGEPGSGKTTLLNALDLCTPEYWRKIYVEDVIESPDESYWGLHQVKFKVRTYEDERRGQTAGSSKYDEIIKLLHRTPDYVILGEVQTEEHVKALFHALSTGIRGIATTHANDIRSLILRYVELYKVHPINIGLIDVFVVMSKLRSPEKVHRFVKMVYETKPIEDFRDPFKSFILTYSGSPNGSPSLNVPIEQLPIIKKISYDECIDEESLIAEYQLYIRILNEVLSAKAFDADEFLHLFRHKIFLVKNSMRVPAYEIV